MCCLQETYLSFKDTVCLKIKGSRKILHINRNQKKVGVVILILDKIDFMSKTVTKDKEDNYLMIKDLSRG